MKLLISIIIVLFFEANVFTGKNTTNCSSLNGNSSNSYYSKKDSSQIIIMANYNQINSIPELLGSFKNKPVFIDLWATLCNPCLKEFEFCRPLFDFLTSRGIAVVYISFDKEKDDKIWRESIKKNKLFGNHIRANKLLQDSLTTLIWGGIDAYSIPRYLLFNKNGKIVNKNNLPPSEGEKLFLQIAYDLKEK